MDYSLLTGLTATTPTLLEGYSEKATSENWDTFSGEFAFPASAAANCKARLNPGQLVPGYTHCYITDATFRDDGMAMIASVSGMGFVHVTTTRVVFSGSGGDANSWGHTDGSLGSYSFYRTGGVNIRATEFRIITTTIPFDILRTQIDPPIVPTVMPSDPSWYTKASDWYLDDIDPTTAGTVFLTKMVYNYRSTGV